MLLHYLRKLKIQIFCIYSADMEENATHRILSAPMNSLPVSRDILRTVLWVCGLSSWLKTSIINSLNVFSLRALRGLLLPGPVHCACVPQLFQQLIDTMLQLFSGNSSVNLFAVYPFKYKLFIKILSSSLNTMLIVDKHYSDVSVLWRISGAINWSEK